jgi:hypothetical protein
MFCTYTTHTQPLTSAQFGIAGGMKKAANFQDLQEMAKQQQQQQAQQRAPTSDNNVGSMAGMNMEDLMVKMAGGGAGGGADLAKMLEETLNDPETKKMYEQLGDTFTQALDQLAQLSPEDLEKQMAEAFNMMTNGPMVDQVVQNREDVLKQLAASGTVPPEELAKMKLDPEYFELKMRESFDQMKQLMGDPSMQKVMAEAFTGMKELFEGGGDGAGDLLSNIAQMFGSAVEDLSDPTKIEEVRLTLLSGQGPAADNPFLKELVANEEMQALLRDPAKFRASVMEGQEKLTLETKKLGGAGVGEL